MAARSSGTEQRASSAPAAAAASSAAAGEGAAEGEVARLRRELARKNEQLERLERAKTAAELRAAAQKDLARGTSSPAPYYTQRKQTVAEKLCGAGRRRSIRRGSEH